MCRYYKHIYKQCGHVVAIENDSFTWQSRFIQSADQRYNFRYGGLAKEVCGKELSGKCFKEQYEDPKVYMEGDNWDCRQCTYLANPAPMELREVEFLTPDWLEEMQKNELDVIRWNCKRLGKDPSRDIQRRQAKNRAWMLNWSTKARAEGFNVVDEYTKAEPKLNLRPEMEAPHLTGATFSAAQPYHSQQQPNRQPQFHSPGGYYQGHDFVPAYREGRGPTQRPSQSRTYQDANQRRDRDYRQSRAAGGHHSRDPQQHPNYPDAQVYEVAPGAARRAQPRQYQQASHRPTARDSRQDYHSEHSSQEASETGSDTKSEYETPEPTTTTYMVKKKKDASSHTPRPERKSTKDHSKHEPGNSKEKSKRVGVKCSEKRDKTSEARTETTEKRTLKTRGGKVYLVKPKA